MAREQTGAAGRRKANGAEQPPRPSAEAAAAARTSCSKYYRDMLLIRRFEERAGQLYGMGLIGGFCHLYIGQEAIAVGVQAAQAARRPGDHRLPRPRPHAGLRHGPQGGHGRADRPRRRLVQGQGRVDAHVLDRGRLLRRPRHRRRPGEPRHRPGARQPLPRRRQGLPSPTSATARPTRARSTRASTWPSSGACRSSM